MATEGTINTYDQWARGSEPYVGNSANYPFYLDKIDRALVYGGAPSQVHDLFASHGHYYQDIASIYDQNNDGVPDSDPTFVLRKEGTNNYTYLHNYYPGSPAGVQFAADPGLAAWRNNYLSRLTTTSNAGYVGVMQDDVNPGQVNTVDSTNVFVTPHDARTGTGMTLANWNKYLAEQVEGNAAAFPALELVSNMHWYSGNSGFTRGFNDQYIARIIDASDFILLENSLSGMTGDNDIAWTFSFSALRDFCDFCRTKGTNLIWFTSNHIDREYELAVYFLFSNGSDYVGVVLTSGNPATYNTMYDINLGVATSARYQWTGGGVSLWRRDFASGMILVNGPGMPTATNIALPGTYLDTSGAQVTTVTLAPQRGAVLRTVSNTPPPDPDPTPSATRLAIPRTVNPAGRVGGRAKVGIGGGI